MKLHLPSLLFLLLTISFGCSEDGFLVPVKSQKLDHYIEYYQFTEEEPIPYQKVEYRYDSLGKLEAFIASTYDSTSNTFKEESRSVFFYNGASVEKIIVFLSVSPDPYKVYDYEYADGKVAKITEQYPGSSNKSTAAFEYAKDNTVTVTYTAMNGNSFNYQFQTKRGNIVSSQSIRGSQLCNEGSYEYDMHPNPFYSLGYLDFHLANYSRNNKLEEVVKYMACAFPEQIVDHYEYQYNESGFPEVATSVYQSSGSTNPVSKRHFFYTTH